MDWTLRSPPGRVGLAPMHLLLHLLLHWLLHLMLLLLRQEAKI